MSRNWSPPMSTCPGCGEVKFIGHGPLCAACFLGRVADPRPCRGTNANVCVAEGCYGEACRSIPCPTCRHPLDSAAHHAECVAPLDQVVGGEG